MPNFCYTKDEVIEIMKRFVTEYGINIIAYENGDNEEIFKDITEFVNKVNKDYLNA
jgi:hypothetical protein